MILTSSSSSEFYIEENIFLSMFLIFFIVAPKIGYFDFTVVFLILALFVSLKSFSFNRSFILYILTIIMVLIVVSFSSVVNSMFSSELILKPIRLILISTLLYYIARANHVTIDGSLKIILFAGMLNSIVVISQVLFSLSGVDDSFLHFYPSGATHGALRKAGLAAGYASSGALSAISALLALWFYFVYKIKSYLFPSLLCLPGVFLSSRMAIILFCIFSPFVFLGGVKRKNFRSILSYSIIITILASLVLLASKANQRISDLVYVMFEFVFVFLGDGKIGIRSTDDLFLNHYFLPDGGFQAWFFGNSLLPWGDGGIPSDVWFVQTLVGSGLLVTVMYLLAFFILFYVALCKCRRKSRFCIFVIFSIVFISSFKGSFIFSRIVGDTATLVGVVALAQISNLKMRREFDSD
jgi:hypothetical protein